MSSREERLSGAFMEFDSITGTLLLLHPAQSTLIQEYTLRPLRTPRTPGGMRKVARAGLPIYVDRDRRYNFVRVPNHTDSGGYTTSISELSNI